jgi:hypothetical protein
MLADLGAEVFSILIIQVVLGWCLVLFLEKLLDWLLEKTHFS